MKITYVFIIAVILVIISCKKETSTEPGDQPPPATIIKDSLTVQSIKQILYDQGVTYTYTNNYSLDTVSNTIKLAEIYDDQVYTDSTVRIFYYNNNKQLIAIKDDGLPVIEFTRDAAGKLLTTTTHYQNAVVNESTGTFTYGTQGTGITITYLDSVLKFPGSNPYDGRSFYRYTFSPDTTVTSYEAFYISTNGTYSKETYTYDNNKNLIAVANKDTLGNSLYNISYVRESVRHTALTSFFKRLGGDLFWFYQTKTLVIIPYIFNEFDYPFALSAPKKINYPFAINGSLFSSFNNTYDNKGNLISTVESNDSGEIISKTEITYTP